MNEVFISYARPDRKLAAGLAGVLEERGYSVWWDRELVAGQEFDATIRRVLDSCRAAIVIWTHASVGSRWVLGEAETAASKRKLIPVLADDLAPEELPIGFRALHTVTLSDTDGLLNAVKGQ